MWTLIKRLCSLLSRKRITGPSAQPTSTALPKEFISFYILGEDFYNFHADADFSDFLKWLKEVHNDWYKANKQTLSSVKSKAFIDIIEALYTSSMPVDNPSKLKELFSFWYGLKHSVFMPAQNERMFLTTSNGHLLQVLYKVQDNEVIKVGSSTEISTILKGMEAFKNNWIIGLADSDGKLSQIAQMLVERVPLQATNFHFVSDNGNTYDEYVNTLTSRQFTNFTICPFKSVTTLQNDKIQVQRLNRYTLFDNFAEKANETFMKFLSEDERAKSFHDSYLLSVWNDKQNIKNHVTYINVAFGSRPLIVTQHNKGFNSIIEQGARLCFYRMVNGFVSISIFPAQTDNRSPEEQSIILYDYVDPHKLGNNKFVKSCWKDLMAYMEYTAIDGRPSYMQKRIVSKLRYNCHLVIDGKYQPTRKSIVWQNRWSFIKTVGLSGFLVAMLQLGYNLIENNTNKKSTVETIIQRIDSIQAQMLSSVDSIEKAVNHLQPKTLVEDNIKQK